jgi:hypothetical protein
MTVMCATQPAGVRSGWGNASRTGSLKGVPNDSSGTPDARCAAAGAKISRPWKVRLTAGSQYSGLSR